MERSLRKTGRISKTMLLQIFHDVCRIGCPSSNLALLLLRGCGILLPEVHPEQRTELVHRVWERMEDLGVKYGVVFYNTLLNTYLQNDFKFSPTDFLAKMEAANIHPNMVTYQRLIASYCQSGDMEGARTILGFMKSQDIPITESIFSSLVTGHARAGDIESAKDILPLMKGTGITPGPSTYLSLLCAYAEKGDIDSMKKTLEEVDQMVFSLTDKDILQVMFVLAKAGHQQHVPEMIKVLKYQSGYIPDSMNACLNLITHNLEDTAFQILMSVLSMEAKNTDNANDRGNYFLRHCVNKGTSLEKLVSYCTELQNSEKHTSPFAFTLKCALEAKNTDLCFKLMKIMEQRNLPLRPHYFWPLYAHHVKAKDTAGVIEVSKGMRELGVPLDKETISTYIIPAFPSSKAARKAFEDAGDSELSKSLFRLEVTSLAPTNLAELYTLVSDPSAPLVTRRTFYAELVTGFAQSDDVESMVKITKMLYTDPRFSPKEYDIAAAASSFIYNVMKKISDQGDVERQEQKLMEFFRQLQAQEDVVILEDIYKGITNLLKSHKVPGLTKVISQGISPVSVNSKVSTDHVQRLTISSELLNILEKRNKENMPCGMILQGIFHQLCITQHDVNLQEALNLKKQYQDKMTGKAYASLINLCSHHNNAEEALILKSELAVKDPSLVMAANTYFSLLKTLVANGKVDEAEDILKEMKEREVLDYDANKRRFLFVLLAAKDDPSTIRRLLKTIFTLGLAKPHSQLCRVLISFYLDRGDLDGAVDAMVECHKNYNIIPHSFHILVALMEKGESELLQKALTLLSEERGELHMLHDLFFAFLKTGHFKEALQVAETPGLRLRPKQLQWFANECLLSEQMEILEMMVDLTAKLPNNDRDEMYCFILSLCKKTNNWQKAEEMWAKMENEELSPRERTLKLLADILKVNGRTVPFSLPETWYEVDVTTQEGTQKGTQKVNAAPAQIPEANLSQLTTRVYALCKDGAVQAAFKLVKNMHEKGVEFEANMYGFLIRELLLQGHLTQAYAVEEIARSHISNFSLNYKANNLVISHFSNRGQIEDALKTLKTMFQSNQVPSQLALNKLVKAMASQGNLAGIQEVKSLIQGSATPNTVSEVSFITSTALAHIKNGDFDTAVEVLESFVMHSERSSIGYVFKKVLEDNNDEALDRLSVMAERLANHFACYSPATDLFCELLRSDKVEDAKFLLARCNAVAEQRMKLISFMIDCTKSPGQVRHIQNLVSLIPDFEKEALCQCYMKCHYLDNDLPSAKALYEQMLKEGVVLNELTLKRLAELYSKAGEVPPFPEPPESYNFYAQKLKRKTQIECEE